MKHLFWAPRDSSGATAGRACRGGRHARPGFGQLILNGGSYAGARLLSRVAVAAMTRNQTVGIDLKIGGRTVKLGCGWLVDTDARWPHYPGTMRPIGTTWHSGAGGTMRWVDTKYELVGAVCEIGLEYTAEGATATSLVREVFENVVCLAILD